MNEHTALMLSLISKIAQKYRQINLTSVSFKNNLDVDRYVRRASTKFTGITLLKSAIIKRAITKGQELIRFNIESYDLDDKAMTIGIANDGYFKINIKISDTDKLLDFADEIAAMYWKLCNKE